MVLDRRSMPMTKITQSDLSKNDGKEGRQAYVAVDGKVYDVGSSDLWALGSHMQQHQAGADLSEELARAPHGTEVFERMKLAGELIDEPRRAKAPLPGWALKALGYHPHPISIHFPQAFFTFSPIFLVMAYVFKVPEFERTSFYILAAGVLMALPAYATGLFHWRYKFGAKRNFNLRFKMIVSPVLILAGALTLVLHAVHGPLPVDRIHIPILVLQLLLLAVVVSLGHIGGKIAFGGGK